MVYMYVFWNGSGDPPAPWSKIATWDGRYLQVHSDTGSAGSTGGSSTHTHNGSASCGNSTTDPAKSGTSTKMAVHTHTISSLSVGSASIDPTYYTLSIIRVDATTWVSSIRSLPQNACVASTAYISWSELSLLSAALERYIKLSSTTGSTGGSLSHSHSVSGGTDASGTATFSAAPSSSNYAGVNEQSHTHTFSGTVNHSILPSRVKTRLYVVNTSSTTKVPANTVCFFDGSPPSPFQVITSWDGRLIYCADSDPVMDGSSTHGSGTTSFTSSAGPIDNSLISITSPTTTITSRGHTHQISVSLDAADNTPPYARLVPAYLPQDVYLWSPGASVVNTC